MLAETLYKQGEKLATEEGHLDDLTAIYGPAARDVFDVNAAQATQQVEGLQELLTLVVGPSMALGALAVFLYFLWAVFQAAEHGKVFSDYISNKQFWISVFAVFFLYQTGSGYSTGQLVHIQLTSAMNLFADKLAQHTSKSKPQIPNYPPELVIGASQTVGRTLNALVCNREMVRNVGLDDVGVVREVTPDYWTIPFRWGGVEENADTCGRITWYPPATDTARAAQQDIKEATRQLLADLTPLAEMIVGPYSIEQVSEPHVERLRSATDKYVRALANAATKSVDTSAVEEKVRSWRDLGGVYQQAAKLQGEVHAFAAQSMSAATFSPPTGQLLQIRKFLDRRAGEMLQTGMSFAVTQELLTRAFANTAAAAEGITQKRRPLELNITQFCTTIPPSCDTEAMERHVSEWLKDNLLGPEVQKAVAGEDSLTKIRTMGLRKRDTANALIATSAGLKLASAIPIAGEVIGPIAAKLDNWADMLHSAAAIEVDILPMVPVMIIALVNQYYLATSAIITFVLPAILIAAAVGWLQIASRGIAFAAHTMLIPALTVVAVKISMVVLEITFRFSVNSFWSSSAVTTNDGSVYSTLAFTVAFFVLIALTTWKSFQLISSLAQQAFAWIDPSAGAVAAHAQAEDPRHAGHHMPSTASADGAASGVGGLLGKAGKAGAKGAGKAISKIRGVTA